MGSWCALSPCPQTFLQALPKETGKFKIPFLTRCVRITLPASHAGTSAEQGPAYTGIVWPHLCTSTMGSQSPKASVLSHPHKYCYNFKLLSKSSSSGITRGWKNLQDQVQALAQHGQGQHWTLQPFLQRSNSYVSQWDWKIKQIHENSEDKAHLPLRGQIRGSSSAPQETPRTLPAP